MNDQACRNVVNSVNIHKANNAGLILDRYLKTRYKSEDHPSERVQLFKAAIAACASSRELYTLAFKRMEEELKRKPAHKIRYLKSYGRIIVGLSTSSALETGITLHHIYGVPTIPASAIKGLTNHYCNSVWGSKDDKFKTGQKYHKTIFGNNDDSGHIIFYDAWLLPKSIQENSSLILDVMTPHHQDYYKEVPDSAPTDFDKPNPITFLSLGGTFLFCVGCDVPDDEGEKWASLCMDLISDALKYWGIGGETSAGYGTFEPDKKTEDQKRIEQLSPEERIREKVQKMDLKQIKKAFGRNWNKTQKREDFETFKQAAKEIHGEEIKALLEKSNDKKEKKILRRILDAN